MTDRKLDRDGDDGREQALWLNELLDDAADEYEPDAERLKALVTARIAQQSEGDEAGARGLGRLGRLGLAGIPAGVALATIGAAAAIAVGATATIAVTSSGDHHTVTVAASGTSPGAGTTSGGPSSQSAEPSEGASSAATGESTRTATSSAGSTASSGPSALVDAMSSIGQASNPNWSELDLAVTIKQPLTALHVTVKVSKCAGLASTGAWDTGAGGAFTEKTSTDSGGSITYEFELAENHQVQPGTLTFAVQFNHAASGWQPQDDTYYVSARTATSTSASAVGGAY